MGATASCVELTKSLSTADKSSSHAASMASSFLVASLRAFKRASLMVFSKFFSLHMLGWVKTAAPAASCFTLNHNFQITSALQALVSYMLTYPLLSSLGAHTL